MGEVAVDFVAFDKERNVCLMVLVEGPWAGAVEFHLSNLQARMFGCLEAALDGQLADQFPAARGKTVVVRVDCYDVPQVDVQAFFERFSEGVAALPDYATASSSNVERFMFEVNFNVLSNQ